jgi:hypothetical protein
MGYYIEQRECINFLLKKEKFDDALQAIKRLKGKETIKDSSGRHFSWVDDNYAHAGTLKEALSAWRWEVSFDEDGNITRLDFDGQKMGDDEILLKAIAPHVESGMLEFQGEEGERWRWVFKDGKLREQNSEFRWSEDE